MLTPIRATPLGDLNDAQRLAVEHGVGDAEGPEPLLVIAPLRVSAALDESLPRRRCGR